MNHNQYETSMKDELMRIIRNPKTKFVDVNYDGTEPFSWVMDESGKIVFALGTLKYDKYAGHVFLNTAGDMTTKLTGTDIIEKYKSNFVYLDLLKAMRQVKDGIAYRNREKRYEETIDFLKQFTR